MTQEHPITPPPELIREWSQYHDLQEVEALWRTIATKAARWGADQELEACCEWLHEWTLDKHPGGITNLRAARRPKPPSLKEQALGALYAIATGADDTREFHQDLETIKTALESLPD